MPQFENLRSQNESAELFIQPFRQTRRVCFEGEGELSVVLSSLLKAKSHIKLFRSSLRRVRYCEVIIRSHIQYVFNDNLILAMHAVIARPNDSASPADT